MSPTDPNEAMTESELRASILSLAGKYGWKRRAGFATGPELIPKDRDGEPLADNRGFPDAIISKGGVGIFIEFKRERGRVAPEQWDWLWRLTRLPQGESWVDTRYPGLRIIGCVVRPSNRERVERVIMGVEEVPT